MPRTPKYRLHKATGRALVEYKGVRTYLPGKHDSPQSKAAYDAFIAEVRLDQARERRAKSLREVNGDTKQRRQMLVGDLLAKFLEDAAHYYADNQTALNHFVTLSRPVAAAYGKRPIRKFGPAALKRIRQFWVDCGLSRRYCNQQTSRLKQIFRWGVENQYVNANKLIALDAVRPLRKNHCEARETDPVESVAWEIVEQVRDWVPPLIFDMIHLQFLTSMRSDELTGLRALEIDMTDDVWIYKPSEHKTAHHGKEKFICFGVRSKEILRRYLSTKVDAFLFQPAVAMAQRREQQRAGRKTPLTPSQRHREENAKREYRPRYTASTYRKAINYAFDRMEAAGLEVERWHPHQLRHSRATLTRGTYGIEGSAAQTGNSVEAAQIYAERSLELAKRIARETG